MHIRYSTRRKDGKIYRTPQLVESYRREDGMPAHRIIAGLGGLSAVAVDNLRVALRASRQERAVVVSEERPTGKRPQILANLRYLDVAVLLEIWRSWELDSVLGDLLPSTEEAAPGADVVAALTIQRSIDPGSKLFCQRWLPTTALPELLDMAPARFNNTRVHRVLDQIHQATPALQERLPMLYKAREVPTSAFFIDVTDTYFEGRGCELAQRHRTKAGHRNKWSIGLVLLVNDAGLPLRWQVVASKTADHIAMTAMVQEISGVEWLGEHPVVFDRAMGRDTTLHELLNSGVRFLTAAPVSSIESHSTSLPHTSFSKLELKGTDSSREADLALLREAARAAGLEEVDDSQFVLDLGVVDLACGSTNTPTRRSSPSAKRIGNQATAQIERARELRARLDSGEFRSHRALAQAEGMSRPRVTQLLALLRLPSDILDRVLAAPPEFNVTENLLRPLVHEKDPEKQREKFEIIVAANRRTAPNDRARSKPRQPAPNRLRLVAYFNPGVYLEKRKTAARHLEEIAAFVQELNEELVSAKRTRRESHTRRKIERRLERYHYLNAFEISLEPIEVSSRTGTRVRSFQCKVTLKPDEWARRQRYNGFVLLLAHPDLPHPARKLATLFREKDTVEKDFQTIKSVVKLRPIYHHTDPKVQAHVTICMLALLLQRTLQHRLRQSGVGLSAEAALEILRPCHLNRVRRGSNGPSIYVKTNESAAQGEILEALGLSCLLDDERIATAIS